MKNINLLYCKGTVLSQENANYERKRDETRWEGKRKDDYMKCINWFWREKKRKQRWENTTSNVQVEIWEIKETWKMREEKIKYLSYIWTEETTYSRWDVKNKLWVKNRLQ